MKIGITAFHAADNYGSVLLVYGLKRTLEKNGFDSEVIDFIPKSQEEAYKIIRPIKSKGLILHNIYSLLNLKALKNKKDKFKNFRNKYMNLTNTKYNNLSELLDNPPICDAYVCGSDQIWNPNTIDFDEAYFLPYGGNNIKKIAYAPSLGPNDLTLTQKNLLKKYIENIDFLSVREEEGKEILEELTDKNIEVLIDPALLLDEEEWKNILIEPNINTKYILCYFIGNGMYLEKISKKIQEQTNLPIVILMPNWRNITKSYIKRYDTGPEEFLGLIKNAEYIVTNSFHATVFSLIFKKNFFVGSTQTNKNDSRLVTLLTKFGLSNRLVSSLEHLNVDLNKIDFSKYEQLIEIEREKAKQYLLNCLS